MSIRKDNTKIYSVRLDKDLIEDFVWSCKNLPISYKASALIESYMKYIIEMSKDYKESGHCKMGFLKKNGTTVLYDSVGQQLSFSIDSKDINYEKKRE